MQEAWNPAKPGGSSKMSEKWTEPLDALTDNEASRKSPAKMLQMLLSTYFKVCSALQDVACIVQLQAG